MFQHFLGFVLLLLFVHISSIYSIDLTKEAELEAFLLTNYNKQVRPAINDNVTINVSFSFEIHQILAVDDRAQHMTLKVWVRQFTETVWKPGYYTAMHWKNEFLIWDPLKWDNITEVKFPRTHVWIPDILLHNNAGYGVAGGISIYLTDIIVDHTGYTSWLSPASFTSSCKLDMRNFPFDQQVCSLKFSSWTEDVSKVNLIKSNAPLLTENFQKSAQWEITSATSEIILKKYDCCPYAFGEIVFTLKMNRKSLYFTFNVITPCIVLVVNIFVGFFLPPDCGERVSLTITILLAVAVFLQLVSGNLPRNSDSIPLLAIFYIVIMCESALSLISTCIVLIVYHHTTDLNPKPIPIWMKRVFVGFFAKVLQVKRDNQRDNTVYYDHFQDDVAFNYEALVEENQRIGINNKGGEKGFHRDPNLNMKADLLKEVQKIRALLMKRETTKEEAELQEEWKYLAKILDRVFFWLFVFTIVVTGCWILLPAYIEQANASSSLELTD